MSVYNGEFLPEIILLLTLCDNIGERIAFVLTVNVLIPSNKPFDCSEGLAAFRFFLKHLHGI